MAGRSCAVGTGKDPEKWATEHKASNDKCLKRPEANAYPLAEGQGPRAEHHIIAYSHCHPLLAQPDP